MAAILAILGLLAEAFALVGIAWAVSWRMGKPEYPEEHCGWVEVAEEPEMAATRETRGGGSCGGQRPEQDTSLTHVEERV